MPLLFYISFSILKVHFLFAISEAQPGILFVPKTFIYKCIFTMCLIFVYPSV